MPKVDYDVFDIMTGKFSKKDVLDNFVEDLQIAQAEYKIVKAILEHHLEKPSKKESGD
tara:strand:+ start:13 stop:186 length:174 start_codon:yes stop_codon:yes gene_type:complete